MTTFKITDRATATVGAGTLVEVYDADGTPKKALVSALGAVGPTGPAGATGATGAAGQNAPVYNSSGLISGAKIWLGTATCDSSGVWSANCSSAGFSGAPTVFVSIGGTPGDLSGFAGSRTYEATTTSISGQCYAILESGDPPVFSLGPLGMSGLIVTILAIGN